MRKLGLLAGLLFLVLLVLAGGYGFYWYQVKRQVDGVIADLRPILNVEYTGLYVNPLSEIRVNGIRATPPGQTDALTIGAISWRSSDPLFLMDPGRALERGRYPAQFSIALEGLGINLNAPWLREYEQQLLLLDEPDLVSPEALGCGDLTSLDLAALREMNIRRLEMDLYTVTQFDQSAGEVRMDSDLQLRQLASIGSSARLTFPAGQVSPEMMMGTLRMNRLAFNYTDLGYNQRKADFCAAQSGLSQEEYLELHAGLFRQWLAADGVYLDDRLADLYLELNRPQARMEFMLSPPGGIGPELIMMMHDVDMLMEHLGPVLNVNDKTLLLADLDWAALFTPPAAASVRTPERAAQTTPQVVAESAAPALNDTVSLASEEVESEPMAHADQGETDGVVEAAEPVAQAPAEIALLMPGIPARPTGPPQRRFQPTEPDDLGQYIGLPVRFYTVMGKRVEGRLTGFDDGTLRVEQRVSRGMAEYPVSLDRIQALEVYR